MEVRTIIVMVIMLTLIADVCNANSAVCNDDDHITPHDSDSDYCHE